jgi:hypothetical protein
MAGTKNGVLVGKNADFSQFDGPSGTSGEANGLVTDGKMWIGSTALNVGGTHINVGSLTSSDNSITFSYASPNLDAVVAGGSNVGKTITGDTGGALNPSAGNWNIVGDGLTTTSGAGSTLTINSPSSIESVIRGPDVNFLAVGNTSIYTFSAAFVVTGVVIINTSLTGVSVQDAVFNLGWTAANYNDIVSGASGSSIPGGSTHEVGFFLPAQANDFPIIPAGQTLKIRVTTPESGATVYVNRVDIVGYYFAGVPPNPPTLPITYTANDAGTASPAVGNVNIFGRSGCSTIASSSTLTVLSPAYADASASATSAKNTGEFVTGAYTRTLPASAGLADGDLIEYVCTTASVLVIQAVGAQKIRIGNALSSAAGTATSSGLAGDSVSLRFRAADGFWYSVGGPEGVWIIA